MVAGFRVLGWYWMGGEEDSKMERDSMMTMRQLRKRDEIRAIPLPMGWATWDSEIDSD